MQHPAHGGNLAWASAIAGCPSESIVDFSASISPLGPPSSVLAAIASQLGNLRHYPDPDYRHLKQVLSEFHHLPTEWILPGNGSAELLTLAGRELATLHSTVLITPAFGDYKRSLAAYDAKVLEFPLLNPDIAPTQEKRGIGEDKNIWVCNFPSLLSSLSPLVTQSSGILLNNPHNPTGFIWAQDAILPYLEKFALVVVDEAFMDFLEPNQQQSLIDVVPEHPNLVILRSLTKFYSLPGLRIGYAIAHPERLQKWQSWRDPWSVNTLAQAAAIAALADQEFQQQTWTWLKTAREELFQGLAVIPGLCPLPGAANFLLVRSQQSGLIIQQRLLKHHQILVRDCLSFPELGENYFRVAVRTSGENQQLLTGLREILAHG
ncbi:threonine-phosphate decarboxylase CobD [Calothrix sp. 336/3]|uniref:threonine-phosphate decarboxylase CobD n=1 Tax=Calothrix sp. 336/3 TaxID=1337936 RepID=UPI0004E2AF4F|nr:threonine-phosphate decarboxylase CobD [Calothrix sp. 336/3]AKG23745.1 threonine-phosphate decarboxylase [Calothrix sp. 336/3]